MSERAIPLLAHGIVLLVLILLTIGNVAFSFAHVSGFWHLVVGVTIAALQAALVLLFFMHAITSPRITWCVIVISLFWLVAVLFILTFSDYFTRGTYPHVPGH